MKFKKPRLKDTADNRRTAKEDMQYLQKKISGRSVYKNLTTLYSRTPKHKKLNYRYQD